MTVLRDGYRVPFKDSPPPLARTPVSFPTYRAGSPRAQALRQEVEAMLAKGALEIARDPGPGFYSRLFLVEKATGGWRPVIDLSHLNDFVQLTPFKMETVASVLLSVREGDFLASMFVDQPPSEMDGVFRRPSRSEVSSRRVQRPGRCTQPSLANCGDRVVSPPSGGESTSSCVGQSANRPVCDLPQCEAAPVLLACPGSTGRLQGCVSPSLGRPGPLRVPSLCSGRSGDRSRPAVIVSRDDAGRTSLAREGVVRRLAASAEPTTPGSTLLGQAASAAPVQPVPSRRLRAEPSRVATLKRHY